jgi:hypothetical protein
MSNQTASNIFVVALKALVISTVKIALIAFAWTIKLIGVTLTKCAETIEKIMIKRSTL